MDWSKNYSRVAVLDSCNIKHSFSRFALLVGLGVRREYQYLSGDPWSQLQDFVGHDPDWVFGHFSFELGLPDLDTLALKAPSIPFGLCSFFQPEVILKFGNQEVEIGIFGDYIQAEAIYKDLTACLPNTLTITGKVSTPEIFPVHSDTEYLDRVHFLMDQMYRGNMYEINYCREYLAQDAQIDPYSCYLRLNSISPAPFSAFYKLDDTFLLCSSPERFLSKRGNTLIAQPIKGTIRRGQSVKDEESLIQQLVASSKEHAENTMIVDLVRNDLSRTAQVGSVQLLEWAVPHSYAHVHHLVSTISSTLDPSKDPSEALRFCFPMGSMTGAPKKRVLEFIQEVEPNGRGIYSGAIGCITPDWDFDFNVVIRSLVYFKSERILNYHVGSGLTVYCNPQEELNELQLKARALRSCLGLEV